MNSITETFVVEQSDEGERLDKWLCAKLQDEEYDVSRSLIQDWISKGHIRGSKQKLKSSDNIVSGQEFQVRVPSEEPAEVFGDDVDLEIVYEDEDVIVVNKPRGLVVHPAAGHKRGTLINGLVQRGVRLSELGGESRPGVVHRIDKDTSGLVMFAKTDAAYYSLSEQLKSHTMIRSYNAIVHGVLIHDEGTIDAPIGRDPHNRQRMAIVSGGKHAITHFFTNERFNDYSFVTCQLETGRTHQIRVHFAYIEHPLAGDPVYGKRRTLTINGQALHAKTLGFVHPRSGLNLMFEAELPEDMLKLLDQLRQGV